VGNPPHPPQLVPSALKNHLNMENAKLEAPVYSSIIICAINSLKETLESLSNCWMATFFSSW
jgi:hypothetical protein